MDWDELDPRKEVPARRNLDVMGIEELRDYIAGLEEEIARARAMIDSKQGARAGAETFFRK